MTCANSFHVPHTVIKRPLRDEIPKFHDLPGWKPVTVTFFPQMIDYRYSDKPIKVTLTKMIKLVKLNTRGIFECLLPDGRVGMLKYWSRQCIRPTADCRYNVETAAHTIFKGDPFIAPLLYKGEITEGFPQGYATITEKRPGIPLSLVPRTYDNYNGILGHLILFFGLCKGHEIKHDTIYRDNFLWDKDSNTVTVTGWESLSPHPRLAADGKEVEGRGFDEEVFARVWRGEEVGPFEDEGPQVGWMPLVYPDKVRPKMIR
ncbi:hypothetical protein TWF718_005349 [Orbilia javanica]|uniref:Uncharacterized protein n=1 Tax=Orbilia javanica TaxID=47235 RepID=A0AAN8MPT5_9PEZI